MMNDTQLGHCIELIVRDGYFPGRRAAEAYLEFLFGDLSFAGRRVLAIEPAGWLSLYAGCRGAAAVLCVDPSARGAAPDERRRFAKRCEELDLQASVQADPGRFPGRAFDTAFDIILIHDSICRFDGDACARLSRNLRAIKHYKLFLKQLFAAAESGATLIVTGYSRHNLFPFFHLSNPFAPGIEWHSQQSPSLWSSLFTQVGFRNPRIRWAAPPALGPVGRALFGNAIGAYFFKSHFVLTLSKSGTR